MPPPLSRRELRRQQEFENDLAQQQGDQRAQAGLMQMLESLYGISQQERFAPARLRGLESEALSRESEAALGPGRLRVMESEAAMGPERLAAQRAETEMKRQELEFRKTAQPYQLRGLEAETKGKEYDTSAGAPARVGAITADTEARRLQNARLPEMLQSQLETAAQARRLAESQEGRAAEIHPLQRDRGVFENEALNLRLPYLQPAAQAEIEASRASTEATRARTGMLPDEQAALRSRTAAQQFENQWAQPQNEQDYAYRQAQIDAMKSLAGQRQLSPHFPYLPPEVQRIELARAYPEIAEMQQRQEQQRLQQQAADQAIQSRAVGPRQETNLDFLLGKAGQAYKSAFMGGPVIDWLRKPR